MSFLHSVSIFEIPRIISIIDFCWRTTFLGFLLVVIGYEDRSAIWFGMSDLVYLWWRPHLQQLHLALCMLCLQKSSRMLWWHKLTWQASPWIYLHAEQRQSRLNPLYHHPYVVTSSAVSYPCSSGQAASYKVPMTSGKSICAQAVAYAANVVFPEGQVR